MFAGEIDAEVLVGEAGGDAAAGGAVEEADLDEEGFVDLFEGVLPPRPGRRPGCSGRPGRRRTSR